MGMIKPLEMEGVKMISLETTLQGLETTPLLMMKIRSNKASPTEIGTTFPYPGICEWHIPLPTVIKNVKMKFRLSH